jgi:predicted dehydrogenase
LRLVGIGCGARTRTYCALAAQQPHRYRVVAGADPDPARVAMLRDLSGNPDFRGFADAEACFAAGRLGDVAIIGTQDDYHVEPALRAMNLGYDLLLEKPIARRPGEIMEVARTARRLGRRALVCHVMRYTALWSRAREIVASGQIGEVVSLDHREGVDAWHQAHSFVRGAWARGADSNPMILAKCCHDTDMIQWIVGRPCERVSSFGALSYFRAEHAPAEAPARCTDGCPRVARCPYSALRYATSQRHPWMDVVAPHLAARATEAEIVAWLATSPYGRCVWRCDNDAVDHQVASMSFAGDVTATMTMTAFERGRHMNVFGTLGTLRVGEGVKTLTGHSMILEDHHGGVQTFDFPAGGGGYDHHGGADGAMVDALADELAKPDAADMRTDIGAAVESHIIALAAEESRLHGGRVVELDGLRRA